MPTKTFLFSNIRFSWHYYKVLTQQNGISEKKFNIPPSTLRTRTNTLTICILLAQNYFDVLITIDTTIIHPLKKEMSPPNVAS